MKERWAGRLPGGLLLGLLLGSCALVGKEGPLPPPPPLRVEFDSGSAAAHLHWEPVLARDFLGYWVQRATGESGEYSVQARLSAAGDTAWSDEELQADVRYHYRIVVHFGSRGRIQRSLTSAAVAGAIHRHCASWPLSDGFLPTRLAVDAAGNLAVAGAGASRVERFDAQGRALDSWTFAVPAPACLETGTLDAVSLGFDSQGALYVAYNLPADGRAPGAWWTKFDAQGRPLWTHSLKGLFARHLAIGPGDRIYLESIDRLYQFDTGGDLVAEHTVPSLLISSLRFWGERFALLIEPMNHLEMGWQAPRLMVYASPEQREAQWSVGREPLSEQDQGRGVLKRPSDFAVDEGRDCVFIVNAGQSRIEVFHRSQYLTAWGREGEAAGAFRFAGEAEVIEDMAAGRITRRRVVAGGITRDQRGFIYVADTFNNRVQKFAP